MSKIKYLNTFEQSGPQTGRILRLDGVRALSIILVLLAHTFPLGPKAWLLNAMAGRMGMALFFCLSGFLIVSMLHRNPNIYLFLTKRIMRIVPALFLYLIILLIFFDLPLSSFVVNLLFISNYMTEGLSGGPVGHLWSLAVEVQFYVAISMLVLIGGHKAVWLVFPAAIIVTILRINAGAMTNINTHLRVDEILVGGWLALLSLRFRKTFGYWLSFPFLASALLIMLTALFMISSHEVGASLNYLRPYITMLLVGTLLHCNLKPLLKVFESQIAQYIARISYALYIWHPLMIFAWMNQGTTLERYLFKRPVSWTLSIIAAHLSTTYWESYWQKVVRRWHG